MLLLFQSGFGGGAPPPLLKCWIKVAGVWKEGTVWINDTGTWKLGTIGLKVAGTWKTP